MRLIVCIADSTQLDGGTTTLGPAGFMIFLPGSGEAAWNVPVTSG